MTAHSHSTYSNTATHAQAAGASLPAKVPCPAGRTETALVTLGSPPAAAPCLSATTWLLLYVSVDCAPHCGGAPTDPTRRVERTHHQRSGARASILPFFVRRWIGWVGWYAGWGRRVGCRLCSVACLLACRSGCRGTQAPSASHPPLPGTGTGTPRARTREPSSTTHQTRFWLRCPPRGRHRRTRASPIPPGLGLPSINTLSTVATAARLASRSSGRRRGCGAVRP